MKMKVVKFQEPDVISDNDDNSQDDSLFTGFRRHLVKSKWGKRIVNEIADIDISSILNFSI